MPDQQNETASQRQVLQLERRLYHPVERVWDSLIDPAQLGQWYPFVVVSLDPRVGGTISFDDGEGTIYHGEIHELERPRVLSFTEENDLIHIELMPEPSGCVMVFTHTFDDPSIAESVETGWKECFRELEQLLDR